MQNTATASTHRRSYPRRSFTKKMGLLYRGKYYVGAGLQLGEGGFSVLIKTEFKIEDQVVVSFQMPQLGFISLRATVRDVFNEGYGFTVGFSFDDLVFDCKRQIRTYVSSQ